MKTLSLSVVIPTLNAAADIDVLLGLIEEQSVKPREILVVDSSRRNRDSITFDEWVDLDLLYVKQCSAWADFKLVVQTVGVVLTAQGS